MKTELIFLWIEWDENGCFQKMNFNFHHVINWNLTIRVRG